MQDGRRHCDLDGEGAVRLVAALLAAIAACSGKQADPTASCAAAARHAVDSMVTQARDRLASAQLADDARARVEARTQQLVDVAPRLAAVITNRCVDDKWPASVIACYRDASSLDAIRTCRKQLSPEQQARLQKDELDLMAGPSGPPGFVPGSDPTRPSPLEPARPAHLRLEALKHEINEAMKKVASAPNAAAREQLRARLDALIAERDALARQRSGDSAPLDAGATAPQPAP